MFRQHSALWIGSQFIELKFFPHKKAADRPLSFGWTQPYRNELNAISKQGIAKFLNFFCAQTIDTVICLVLLGTYETTIIFSFSWGMLAVFAKVDVAIFSTCFFTFEGLFILVTLIVFSFSFSLGLITDLASDNIWTNFSTSFCTSYGCITLRNKIIFSSSFCTSYGCIALRCSSSLGLILYNAIISSSSVSLIIYNSGIF